MDDLGVSYKILEEISTLKVDIAEIKRDLAHHIERTKLNEERITLVENYHLNCPAVAAINAKKTLFAYAKDVTVVIGLIVVILKLFNLIPFTF
jgi:hypothetical protein